MVSRWEAVKEMTKAFLGKDLSKFNFTQKLFFWINMLSSYLGFLSSLNEPHLTPTKTMLSFAEKLLTLFSLTGNNGKYALTSKWRLLSVDGEMYFYSIQSGEWLNYSREKIPFEQLEEKGVLRLITAG
jgi:hypothetical protein